MNASPVLPILGNSAPVKEMLKLIAQVAKAKTNILIIGESGTGKELVARLIHDSGPLKGKPFIPVNCGAIPETLIESEMFGHRKGSFTGAVAEKAGLFEAANGGTLFLDEVGELPLGMQVKLLRAIQERSFRKVGGTEDIRVDVRIIAATNRDLEAAVKKGTFREDLFYRLNVILIQTPPLRERPGDVKLLAEHFLKKAAGKQAKTFAGFAPETMAILETHPWPGNVRELENVIERAVTLENEDRITVDSLPEAMQALAPRSGRAALAPSASASSSAASSADEGLNIELPPADFSGGKKVNLDEILAGVERVYLTAALESCGGDRKKAGELLGVTARSLRYRMTKLGLKSSDNDEGSED